MVITKEIASRVKAENPDVELHVLEATGQEVIVRPPTRGEYEVYKNKLADAKPGKRMAANEALVRGVLVYPSIEEFDALLEEKPGLVESYLEKVLELAGLVEDSTSRKL